MAEKRISKLAISSVILSISSVFLGLTWIPGVICGHLARARIKSNPDLRGQPLAFAGLITGYFFPVALIAIVLYLSGYLERQVTVVDQGQKVWVGHFPHDANENIDANKNDSQFRPDKVLTPIIIRGKVVGNIESRDHNLRLVFKPNGVKKEVTIWEYADYGEVTKITVDDANNSLILYFNHTLIRDKDYIALVSLKDFTTHKQLVNRGRWRI